MHPKSCGRRRSGALLMWLGGILMVAALGLAAYNAWDEYRAAAAANAVVVELAQMTERPAEPQPSGTPQQPAPSVGETAPSVTETPEEVPDYVLYPEKVMPMAQVNGYDCLGIVEIPALGRTLPVLESCTDSSLKIAPGCYYGSVYQKDMVIAGHNYTSHFAKLRSLKAGDPVYFTDLDGNRFCYEVADLETLEPTDIEGMTTGDWDMTLFTCTYGNRHRLAVRCFLID